MTQTDTDNVQSGRRQMRLEPEVLRWARERAGIEVEDLAKKFQSNPRTWRNGNAQDLYQEIKQRRLPDPHTPRLGTCS